MTSLAITHANLVLESEILENGTVLVQGGYIQELGPSESLQANGLPEVDARGSYLMPGIIDTHNDSLELEINPRPRVKFPKPFALANFERRALAAGVTTAYHAVMFAELPMKERSLEEARLVAELVNAAPQRRLDHRMLYRLDLWCPEGLDSLFECLSQSLAPAVSLNDHTPGQGQFRNLEEYRKTLSSNRGGAVPYFDPDEDVDQVIATRAQDRETVAAVLARLRREREQRHFVLASHDDDTPEKVRLMHQEGVGVAEFPVTREAARRHRELGASVTVGAPNIVRGGSTSLNLAATDLVSEGLADIICADYHAPSLLRAAWRLAELGLLGLPAAVAMLTANPAHAFGLTDRGRLAPGGLADLCLVTAADGNGPEVCQVWRQGRLAYACSREIEL